MLAHDDEQLAIARESARRLEKTLGRKIATRIEPLQRFSRAEDYHQKYYLRGESTVLRDFQQMYPDAPAFTDSTAAMLANGYLYGAGSCMRLATELSQLGLSTEAEEALRSRCR